MIDLIPIVHAGGTLDRATYDTGNAVFRFLGTIGNLLIWTIAALIIYKVWEFFKGGLGLDDDESVKNKETHKASIFGEDTPTETPKKRRKRKE